MKPVTERSGLAWAGLSLAVVLVVLASTAGDAVASYYFTAKIGVTDTQLDAVPGGGPAWVRYDGSGDNLLIWGHEGPDDIRLLGRDLSTRKVLELPSPGYTVKGVEWGDTYDRIVVWGSPGAGLNDTLVFYRSPGWSIEEGYLPDDLLPLVEIDYARFFASDVIFAVAGRDADGTSRVLVVETGPMDLLRNNTVQEDRSVACIGKDDRFMYVLDAMGRLILYSTMDWTPILHRDMFQSPFSSHFIESGNIERVFGGANGNVTSQVDVDRNYWAEFSTGTGPVLGVWFSEIQEGASYIVAATSEEAGSSTLQIWDPLGGSEWTLHRKTTIDGTVSMLAMDPANNSTIVVAFQDGSLAMYELLVERHKKEERASDWWVPLVVIPLSIVVLAGILYFVWTMLRKRRSD